MLLKNSENEAPQKLCQIALRANILVQSHLRRAIADAGDFPVNFGIPQIFFCLSRPRPCESWLNAEIGVFQRYL